jgi:hypothetical protein
MSEQTVLDAIAALQTTVDQFADLGDIAAAVRLLVIAGVERDVDLPDFPFKMYLAGTKDPALGKTVTVRIGLDGGALGTATNSPASEIGEGWYKVTFARADVDAKTIALEASASGCDPTSLTIITSGATP